MPRISEGRGVERHRIARSRIHSQCSSGNGSIPASPICWSVHQGAAEGRVTHRTASNTGANTSACTGAISDYPINPARRSLTEAYTGREVWRTLSPGADAIEPPALAGHGAGPILLKAALRCCAKSAASNSGIGKPARPALRQARMIAWSLPELIGPLVTGYPRS